MNKSYATILDLQKVDFGLLFFRIAISSLMLTHGIPKLIRFFGSEEIRFANPIGLGETSSFALTVFAEFLCSVLIIIGLGTRLAAIALIITMAVAALIVHMPDGFARQELPLLYLAGYILLLFTGSGKYSLDHYFLRRRKK
ncbi:DoxX family protein [Salinimicrobium sp. GXAS 041]|uniref:DoxX family protein n=1 Tax=Salinimicrobium sp. GXAS 041 TaxID=3400806 RepID=UPI003C758593